MSSRIIIDNQIFILNTKNTTYCFHVLPSGHLEHFYYGERVDFQGHYENLFCECAFPEGNLNVYDEAFPTIALENRCLEVSTRGKGDIREPFVELEYYNGSTTSDFLYKEYRIQVKESLLTLPTAYDEDENAETLVVVLEDVNYGIIMELHYSVFYDTDVITRSSKLFNHSQSSVKVNRLLSTQLDCDHDSYVFTTFKGAWVREMNRYDALCQQGILVNDSKTGGSSNRSNPFVMLSKEGTTEEFGECYACNLIYSGNHYEAVEVNGYDLTHFVCGINPFGFQYILEAGEMLESPEAVMTYTSKGFQGISHQMHEFVRNHIVRGTWKKKERPVLLNSWEASYFNFNEKKLLNLAKAGKDVGIELFVLDDGWFGKRDNDTSSLGDWFVNTKKLPNGIEGLAKKINEMGMDFGIWVEPEMVNYDSDCYRNHPEYTVEIPGQKQSLGRHQLVLDLTQEVVQDYIIEEMTKVFASGNISYVKWDMNRIVSDAFSQGLVPERQGEFYHRYMIGLYRVMGQLNQAFPEILFESCASGGNRFDLGMMCYMPQVWASDNTDAISRAKIQTGCSYGYPMSVIGSHVSASPNHQTLRTTSLDTRFNVAAFGLLGYECNLVDMSKKELEQIKEQITWYKKYRQVLQYGTYYRMKHTENGIYKWMTVAPDKCCALGMYLQTQVKANYIQGIFRTKGLDEEKTYHFTNVPQVFDLRNFGDLVNAVSPIHIKQGGMLHHVAAQFVNMNSEKEDYIVNGKVLNQLGVRLKQSFAGTGFNEEVRHFPDYGSRMYVIEEID